MGWLLNSLIGAFLVSLLTRGAVPKPGSSGGGTAEGGSGYAGVREAAAKLASALGMSSAGARWLGRMMLVQAHSESRGNRLAANRTERESEWSKRLFEARGNAQDLARLTGYPISDRAWYFPGSGGWFGLMPAVLVTVIRGSSAARVRALGLGPASVYDEAASSVMYLRYLYGLTRRSEWLASTRDARALKIGGAAGSLMDDPESPRAQKSLDNLSRAMRSLGIPAGFASEKVPPEITRSHDWLSLIERMRQ